MDRLFGDFFGRSGMAPVEGVAPQSFPAVNVWQRDDAIFVEAEVPGLKSEDVEISVVGNELSLKGRRPDLAEENAAYHRRERGVGDFNRVLRLPAEIAGDKVEAKLTDGVLLITLPKAETAKPRKINVTAK
jgi:HSP20 family protein